MKIIEPSYKILTIDSRNTILETIEHAGRTCYKSEDKITPDSASEFVRRIVRSGHHSVLEHVGFSCLFICDRGVSHELVRHRLASYSQESTRYANYSHNRFGNEITVIRPHFWETDDANYETWLLAMMAAESSYMRLIEHGARPEEARSVLPNSLKTEVVMTTNMREWRHVLGLRCGIGAHPQIRELLTPLLVHMALLLPEIFGDVAERAIGRDGVETC